MTTIVERLQDLGEDNWALYKRAREMLDNGEDIIELAIGEPDIPTPGYIIESLQRGLANGRTGYSDSAGEARLRDALAQRYSRPGTAAIRPAEILCFPGAQTALYAALRCVAGPLRAWQPSPHRGLGRGAAAHCGWVPAYLPDAVTACAFCADRLWAGTLPCRNLQDVVRQRADGHHPAAA